MGESLTGVIDTVYSEPQGSVLAADASSGAGSVFVEDTSDFDDTNGGTLSIGGTQYAYSTVNETTGEITLDGVTLAANATAGDRVDVWDDANGQRAEVPMAHVSLPGAQAGDEPVIASLDPALAITLDEGIRRPGEGEPVRLEMDDAGEWVAHSAKRKKPVVKTSAGGQNVVTGDSSASNTVSISGTLTGPGTSIGGNNGVAVGDEANATGSQNTALGVQSQANGTYCTAVGDGAVAGTGTQTDVTAVGARSAADHDGATAVGASAVAGADNATAIGVGASCSTANGTVIGASGGLLGLLGATPVAQQATPVTLADVIAILQAFGLCS